MKRADSRFAEHRRESLLARVRELSSKCWRTGPVLVDLAAQPDRSGAGVAGEVDLPVMKVR